jgi:hypothetical protein
MNIEASWDWATHQPLIHLMMSEFHPELVLELGIGNNSTPAFLQYEPKQYIGIENDKAWIDLMRKQFPLKPEYEIRFHDLGDTKINLATKVQCLSEKVIAESFSYYMKLRDQVDKKNLYPKLLFVDHFTGLRTLAIKSLYESFDIIIYHDCQPEGIPWYSYYFDKNMLQTYSQFVLKSQGSWTGLFLSNKLMYSESDLKKKIYPFVRKFCKDTGTDENRMYLDTYYE